MSSNWKVICEDCLKLIPTLSNESLDLVVTSPPYNVDLGHSANHSLPYDTYDDGSKSYETYLEWLTSVFAAIKSKLKSGGRVCVNLGNTKNGRVHNAFDLDFEMTKVLGYLPMTVIMWDKSQTGRRTAWGSFKSPSSPSFPTPFEFILVYAKDSVKLQTKGETDLTKEEFIGWSLPLWKFPGQSNQKKMGHGAMFPVELPKRCIKMFSWIGANVFDPFCGLSSTGVACLQTGRNYLGCDVSQAYIDLSTFRLEKEEKEEE